MMETSGYKYFPCVPENVGSQKCYVGKGLFVTLKARVGQACWVSDSRKKWLCTIWPKKDQQPAHIYWDKTVECNIVENDCVSEPFGDKKAITMCRIKLDVVETISMNIVLSDYSKVPYFKQNLPLLVQLVKENLRFTIVAPSCVINTEKLPLGKLYGIKHVIISSRTSDTFLCGSVCESTEVVVEDIVSIDRYRQRNQFMTISLGGLAHAKTSLKEMGEMLFTKGEVLKKLQVPCPRSVLLRGPPGTGKSSLVKCVALQCKAYLLTVLGPELLASRPGESEENLRKVFHKADVMSQEGPCVLFIDEVDSFCSKKGKGSSNERRVFSQLLALLDELQTSESNVMVVAATNRPAELDPALRRSGRLDREIFIGVPSQTEREDILGILLRGVQLHHSVDLGQLAEATPGYVGADLKLLVQQACYSALKRCTTQVVVDNADFQEALHTTTPSSQKGSDVFVDHKPIHWEDIGGLTQVKAQIKQFIELPIKHPEAFCRLGLPPPRGVLLYGPPGCAKTTLVRAAATSCHVTFLSVSGAQLYSPFVGDSEKKISEIFQQARAGAPCILFLDELDSVIGSRSRDTKQGSVQERVLSTLLNEMDGVGLKVDNLSHREDKVAEGSGLHKRAEYQSIQVDNKSVLFVAATNRPDKIDDAILRPGRIDRIIYVPPPDKQTRRDILHIHTTKMNVHGDIDIEGIAAKTENFTGADLESLCREAALYALTVDGIDVDCVKQEHFEAVLKSAKPSLTPEQIDSYSAIQSLKS